MKITLKMLSKHRKPCPDGVEWFKTQKSHELTDLVENAIKEGMKQMEYCNWGIAQCMTKIQAVSYACYAEQATAYAAEVESSANFFSSAEYAVNSSIYASGEDNKLRLMAKILRYGVKLLMEGK